MAKRQRGVSLVELLAVTVILGILGSAAIAVMRVDSAGNHGAKTTARNLAKDLQQARQRAISTGDDHYLQLAYTGSYVSGYTMYRDDGGSPVAVDSFQQLSDYVQVTIDPEVKLTPSFTFEGGATASYEFTVVGPNLKYQVTVTAATGRAQVTGG